MLEIKGQEGDAALKKAAADRWCRAVTNDGQFGQWSYHLRRQVTTLQEALHGHVRGH